MKLALFIIPIILVNIMAVITVVGLYKNRKTDPVDCVQILSCIAGAYFILLIDVSFVLEMRGIPTFLFSGTMLKG